MKTTCSSLLVRSLVALLATSDARGEWTHIGPVASFDRDDTGILLHCGSAAVRIEATSDQAVRIRLAPDGRFGRDFSWAVTDLAPHGHMTVKSESDGVITLSTGGLTILVHRKPCRVEIRDASGRVLVRDTPQRGMAWETAAAASGPGESGPVRVWQTMPTGTAIFGLGEKTGPLDKRNGAYSMWNTDALYGPGQDPLYQSIPFFIVARDRVYHGVFFDNPWHTSFDFAKESLETMSFGASGGELNYYVIAGPGPKEVIQRYTDLTGRIDLPPKWAIGYQQCRFSYFPEARVREIAQTFRKKRIPCDVLYFDIDYMDGYRCFTWSPRWFPQPRKLMDDLHADGFHTVAIIDPGIKNEPGYPVFDSGTAARVWVTRPDGKPYVGRVWPGDAVFPDFTNPKARDWWAGLFPPFIDQCGLDGIWNDMNEPSDFSQPTHTVPLDVRHDNQGQPSAHPACHNVYGMQMHRATMEGLQRARPNERPFTLTRATYAGGQRFGAAWTGDNMSTWEHLRMSVAMVQGLGVSGMPFVGPDIGGFAFGATPELYARWIQVGSLFPFCRTHTSWDNPDQEPWSFGPRVEAIARRSLERRYELLPYLYTLFEEASRNGIPIVRPMWMEFPDGRGGGWHGEFMLGSDIYVAPILSPEQRDYYHFLPPGIWFDMNNGDIWANGQPVKINATLETLPLFVCAGAVIPMQSPIQSTTHAPAEPLILNAWPFGEGKASVYEDDGTSLAYRAGRFRRTGVACVRTDEGVELKISKPEGSFQPGPRAPLVRLHGLRAPIESVQCVVGTAPASQPVMASRTQIPQGPVPREPGRFFNDPVTGDGLVRLHQDQGASQFVQIKLGRRNPDAKPVTFTFTNREQIGHTSGLQSPAIDAGRARFRVKETWNAGMSLPRRDIAADALNTLRIRLAAGHTRRLKLRFATWGDPMLSERLEIPLDITPGERVRDYAFNLADLGQGRWKGTVYYVRIGFGDGLEEGDMIDIESVSFERAQGAE